MRVHISQKATSCAMSVARRDNNRGGRKLYSVNEWPVVYIRPTGGGDERTCFTATSDASWLRTTNISHLWRRWMIYFMATSSSSSDSDERSTSQRWTVHFYKRWRRLRWNQYDKRREVEKSRWRDGGQNEKEKRPLEIPNFETKWKYETLRFKVMKGWD